MQISAPQTAFGTIFLFVPFFLLLLHVYIDTLSIHLFLYCSFSDTLPASDQKHFSNLTSIESAHGQLTAKFSIYKNLI